jgi:serine/threonine protein phosphatase PrpC
MVTNAPVSASNAPVAQPAPRAETPAIDAAGLTDRGQHRERNEDAFLIASLDRTLTVKESSMQAPPQVTGSSVGLLLMVADGMGGHGGGDVASQVAVATVANYVVNDLPWMPPSASNLASHTSLPGLREGLSAALSSGDARVFDAGQHSSARAMGTTLTMGYVLYPRMYVAHVGDSRCYLLRGRQLSQLTTDHTVAQQLKEAGVIGKESKSEWESALWNALGGGQLGIDPQVVRAMLAPGDVVLLCSDGLTGHVPDEAIARILAEQPSARAACQALVDAANRGGGRDNITAVVARC